VNLADEIEQLRQYPASAADAFRQQLERARAGSEHMIGQVEPVKGIDRSGELAPLARPTILRAVFCAE
jgi:hypothetical protein